MATRSVVRLVSLFLLVMALAACAETPLPAPLPGPPAPTAAGVTAPTAAPPAPTTAPSSETPSSEVAPAQDDWTRAEASGVLRVGSPLDNPPFNEYNADFQPDGFDVALMNEIADRLGLKVEYNDFAFDGLLNALQLDRIDAVIAAMAITADREQVADFTSSYYQGEDIVLAAVNSPITAIAGSADLATNRLGVQRGTVYESWLLKNLVDTGQMPASNVKAYTQPADAVTALNKGQVDLVIMDREPGLSVVSDGKAKEVGKSIYTQDYAIAVRKGSTLERHLNQALARLLEDGTVTRLAEEYLQAEAGKFTPVAPPTEEPQVVATATPAPTPTPALMDDMAYDDDLTYDDTNGVPVVQPGQAIRKGWRIENSGTTTWSPDYRLAYASGNTPASAMGGQPVLMSQSVAPGQRVDVYVDLVAPQVPGVYQGFWEMKTPANKAFGQQIWVKVQVPAPTPTPTPIPPPGLKIDFWPDQASLPAGGSTTLHWRVSGAQNVQLCVPGQACRGVAFSADERVSPPAGSTTYELRAQRADGGWESRYVTVQVAPPVNAATIASFDVDPVNIRPGDWVNLWWTVQGTPGRMALLRNGALIADYMPGTSFRDQPPGSGQQVVYELQLWPAGRDAGEPDKRQRAITIEANPAPPPPQTVELYKNSCMSYQNLRAGDTLKVTLEGQSGTGYVWYESPDYDGSVLMGSGVPAVGGGGAPGAPEIYTFTYAAGRGQTTLTLLYGRQGEGAAAAIEACAITVTVQ